MKSKFLIPLFSTFVVFALLFSGCKKNEGSQIDLPETTSPFAYIKINGSEYTFSGLNYKNVSVDNKYNVSRELKSDVVTFCLEAKNQESSNLTGKTFVIGSEDIKASIKFNGEKYNVNSPVEIKVYKDNMFFFYAISSGVAVSEDGAKSIDYVLGFSE
ncbi:MAG: hypothetical protein ACI358_00695 [Candidatus Limimorpha sp.]